ncbi:MAG: LytR/AlgR family response regulator transcription factor, partial [Gemmatimonadales bacterium]
MSHPRLRVLVADDEPLGRQRLVRLLEQEPDAELVSVCADGQSARAAIRRHDPDLLFLDVEMPALDGFGVLRELGGGERPAVVFVTAHAHYALRAFDAQALDYLLKPFDEERFHRAYTRARDRLAAHTATPPEVPERLAVKNDGRVTFVRTADIDWIEAASNYVRLHVGRETHLIRESMTGIEARLSPGRFLRIHRTMIVNLDRLRELQPWFSGEYIAILADGTRLKVSRG